MGRKDESRIYGLLPSIYRIEDLRQQTSDGHRPLQDLTSIMEETLRLLENDLDGLYENWFIETCDEWVAPYIGDLVDAGLLCSVKGSRALSGKAYVANTIHYRKRKGTVSVFEEIARDITGWDAHVVEFFKLLSTTQNINHPRLENKCTPRIDDVELMGRVGTAFDSVPHMLDVRNMRNGVGYYDVAKVGIFLWRLTAYPVRRAQAFEHDAGRRYFFNSLGMDMPLFNHPQTNGRNDDADDGVLSTNTKEVTVSVPIRREAAKKCLSTYYGENGSILVEETIGESGVLTKVDVKNIVVCDLSNVDSSGNWRRPVEFDDSTNKDGSTNKVAIDPVLGRILFSDTTVSDRRVFVSYYYGFSSDIGGGFYRRDFYESETEDLKTYLISSSTATVANSRSGGFNGDEMSVSIDEAFGKWKRDEAEGLVKEQVVLFEIVDSAIYGVDISQIDVPLGKTLILRSSQEQRATLTAAKVVKGERVHAIEVSGGEGSCFVLDGLLLNKNLCLKIVKKSSNLVSQFSNLKRFVIRHCTIVPFSVGEEAYNDGLIKTDLDPQEKPSNDTVVDSNVVGCSVVVEGNDYLSVSLDKSISGKILMSASKGKLVVYDSILDVGVDGFSVECFEAVLENCTVFGKSNFDILNSASNVIFADTVTVKRRQEGYVRFSYISNRFAQEAGCVSRVPKCYRCQPGEARLSFVPHFTSKIYGAPSYAQLHRDNLKKLFEGADNESEIGVFNQVFQSHRINNLMATFAEYLPFGLTAGVILVT